MEFTIIGILIWLPVVIGFGSPLLLIHHKIYSQALDSVHLVLVPLFGVAMLGITAIMLNFFVPINSMISLIIMAIGLIFFILGSRYLPFRKISFNFIVATFLLLVYTAYSLQKPITHPDSGLYHLQVIKWLIESDLPLGLANLHGRFGFNSIWFPISSMIKIPYWYDEKSIFLANGIVMFSFGLAILGTAFSFKQAKNIVLSTVFLLLTALPWLILAQWKFISSPAPDIPIIFIILLTILAVIKALESNEGQFYYSFIAFFLAAFAITIKISAIPLLLAPAIAFLAEFNKNQAQSGSYKLPVLTLLKISTAVVLVFFIPWIIRGIISSGCIAYPSTFGCFSSLKWAVPLEAVQSEAVWIRSWARLPEVSPEIVLSDWMWLIPWLASFLLNKVVIISFSLLFFGFILLWMAAGEKERALINGRLIILPSLVPLSGIIFWFFTAPNLRFGEGYFWALALVIFSNGVYRFCLAYEFIRFNRIVLITCLSIVLFYTKGLGIINHEELFVKRQEIFFNWPQIPTVKTVENYTEEGIKINTPVADDKCWFEEPLCTPYFDSTLKIIQNKSGQVQEFYKLKE